MALTSRSLILYGYTIDVTNQYIQFKADSGGSILTGVIANGTYSLTDLAVAIENAMSSVDAINTYTVSVDRNVAGGLQNRITIATSGTFLSLYFASGSLAAASVATLLGFLQSDYTGATQYTGSFSSGTSYSPVQIGYNWVAPTRNQKVFGSVNVSAIGLKEAIVFQIQKFFEIEFRYEPESVMETVWEPFFQWVIQQQGLEFTPEVSNPNTFYNCTLEATEEDGQGLAFMMKEMLPEFPGLYRTGKLTFRQSVVTSSLIL